MKQQDWTEEWPTEPGMYWFYGNDVDDKTAGPGEDAHFRLNTVSVRFAGKGDGKFFVKLNHESMRFDGVTFGNFFLITGLVNDPVNFHG